MLKFKLTLKVCSAFKGPKGLLIWDFYVVWIKTLKKYQKKTDTLKKRQIKVEKCQKIVSFENAL